MAADCCVYATAFVACCGVPLAIVACCRVFLIAAAVSVACTAAACIRCIVVNTDGVCPASLVLTIAPKYDGADRSAVDIVAGGLDGDVGVRAGAVVVMLVALCSIAVCSMAAMLARRASSGAARVA